MQADAGTQKEVLDLLRALCRAYAERDADGFLDLLAPDPDTVVLGPGPDAEQPGWVDGAIGREETRGMLGRDWSQSETSRVEVGWHAVSVAGQVAWVSARVTIHRVVGRKEGSWRGRLTAVLERRAKNWLFQQIHFCLPGIRQDSAVPIK